MQLFIHTCFLQQIANGGFRQQSPPQHMYGIGRRDDTNWSACCLACAILRTLHCQSSPLSSCITVALILAKNRRSFFGGDRCDGSGGLLCGHPSPTCHPWNVVLSLLLLGVYSAASAASVACPMTDSRRRQSNRTTTNAPAAASVRSRSNGGDAFRQNGGRCW